jgi:hypothetical protein
VNMFESILTLHLPCDTPGMLPAPEESPFRPEDQPNQTSHDN